MHISRMAPVHAEYLMVSRILGLNEARSDAYGTVVVLSGGGRGVGEGWREDRGLRCLF
jgi:hypothetical protein